MKFFFFFNFSIESFIPGIWKRIKLSWVHMNMINTSKEYHTFRKSYIIHTKPSPRSNPPKSFILNIFSKIKYLGIISYERISGWSKYKCHKSRHLFYWREDFVICLQVVACGVKAKIKVNFVVVVWFEWRCYPICFWQLLFRVRGCSFFLLEKSLVR